MNHKLTKFKDRDLWDTTRVFIYRNLHNSAWSIRAVDGKHKGQVVAHAKAVALDLPVFKVNEAGRQQVIATKSKNVHAGVVGQISDKEPAWLEDVELHRVTYNPYHAGHFYLKDTGREEPVSTARFAVFTDDGKVWVA